MQRRGFFGFIAGLATVLAAPIAWAKGKTRNPLHDHPRSIAPPPMPKSTRELLNTGYLPDDEPQEYKAMWDAIDPDEIGHMLEVQFLEKKRSERHLMSCGAFTRPMNPPRAWTV